MKTITKTLALISLMLFGSAGLMGQKNLLLQDIQPLMSYSTGSRSHIILSADYNSNRYQFYLEEKIQVKDWMINQTEWTGSGSARLSSATRLEEENEMVLEDWMVKEFKTGEQWLSELVKEDNEAPLKLQEWMICCKEWQAVRM